MRKIFILAAVAILAACTGSTELTSPDGEINVSFTISQEGVPHYQVSAYGQAVINESELGLEAVEAELGDGFIVKKVRRSVRDEQWEQPWGENKVMRDNHREMAVEMVNGQGVKLTLRFKAFDDGVGYRYEYDATAVTDSLTIVGDHTYFNFAQDGMSWSIGSYFSGYELPYREQAISATENANTPFTFKMGDIYGSIHEAAHLECERSVRILSSADRLLPVWKLVA